MCHYVAVVLLASAAQKLETEDEQDDANAAASKHALGADVP